MTDLSQAPTGEGALNEQTGAYTDVADEDDETYEYVNTGAAKSALYTFADPGLGAVSITSVSVVARARSSSEGGLFYLYGLLRIGSTVYTHPTTKYVWKSSWADQTWTWTTNPATGNPWTPADLEDLQCGDKINDVSSGMQGQVSKVRRIINYDLLPRTQALIF